MEIDSDDIMLHPFVISIEPNSVEYKTSVGILKNCSIFLIK